MTRFLACALITLVSTVQDEAPLTCDCRLSYGEGGPTRSASAVAGDVVCVSLSIKGLKLDEVETANLAIGAQLQDDKKRIVLDLPESELVLTPHFGGDQLPVSLKLDLPPTLPSGSYQINVAVTDLRTEKKCKCRLPIVVDSLQAGIHERNLKLSYDPRRYIPVFATQSVGQPIYISCELVGVRPVEGEFHIEVSAELIDKRDGLTRTKVKPMSFKQNYDGELATINMKMDELFANRPGKFIWKLKILDKIRGVTREIDIPLRVFE